MAKKSTFLVMVALVIAIIAYHNTSTGQKQWSKELCEAIDNNDIETIQLLLKDESKDVNAYAGSFWALNEMLYDRPIDIACFRSNYTVVKMLIDRGARVDGEEDHDPVASTIEDFDKDDYKILLLP